MMKDEDGIVIVSPYEEAVRKEDAKSTVKAEDVELKPTEEPLPEYRKGSKGRTRRSVRKPKKKSQRKSKKGKKKTEANTKKGRKTKK